MLDMLATGRWLDEARITRIATLSLLMTIAVIGWLLATANGTVDSFGRPLGTDFSNIWSAGRMALDGNAALAWDWPAQRAVQQAIHGDPEIPFYGWHYPPPFLLIAAALATLPYTVASLVWQAATLASALCVVRAIVPGRRTLLVAVGAPVVLVCLGHGHNGFLTAALFGGGMLLLDRKPFVAGLLLGCLIYKPQFGLLLPMILIVGGRWRAIAGASAACASLVGATLLIWGLPVWLAFMGSLDLTRTVVIEGGSTGWEKIQTAFSATRAVGGGVGLAYAIQAAVTSASLAIAALAMWRGAPPLRAAGALVAALLSTPYALDYDFTLAGVAIAFIVSDGRRRGFLRWDLTLLAVCWIAPLIARGVAAATLVPLGLLSALTLAVVVGRRVAVLDLRSSPFRRSHAPSAR